MSFFYCEYLNYMWITLKWSFNLTEFYMINTENSLRDWGFELHINTFTDWKIDEGKEKKIKKNISK